MRAEREYRSSDQRVRRSETLTDNERSPSREPALETRVDPLVSNLQNGLGNQALGGADFTEHGAAMLTHTAGVMGLVAAGVDAGDLAPGSAPLSVMRRVLRRSQAETEGLDTESAATRIGSRQGSPLPEAVKVRMERAFGHDFSHVRIHTDGGAAHAAESLDAVAFAIGRDIYFNRGAWRPGTSAGDELLAHELTHVVQADEGRLPGAKGPGMDVSRPNDPHEREAEAMGRAVARGATAVNTESIGAPVESALQTSSVESVAPEADSQSLAAPASPLSVGAEDSLTVSTGGPSASGDASLASREARPTRASQIRPPTPPSGQAAQQPNSDRPAPGPARITFAGQVIEVQRSGDAQTAPSMTTQLNRTPVPGVTLRTAHLNFDDTETISSGKIVADIQVGELIHATGVELQINRDGTVASQIPEVPFQIGDSIQGSVSLNVSADGIFGSGQVAFDQLPLPAALGINGGGLNVNVTPEGVTGQGTVTGEIPNIGTTQAEVGFDGTSLSARVSITLAAPMQPVPHVDIQHGSLSGEWTQGSEDLPLEGVIGVNVHSWVAGEILARYNLASGMFTLTGELAQETELTFGELASISANMRLSVVDNALEQAHVDMEWTAPRLKGTLNATYDFETRTVTGESTAEQTEDLALTADWGSFTLKAGGSFNATVTANEITALNGTVPFEASITVGDSPVRIDGRVTGEKDPETGEMTGEVNGLLLDDVLLVTDRGDSLTLEQDAVVRASLAGTALTQVCLDAAIRFDRDGEELLTGHITDAVYEPASSNLSFVGDLVLGRDIEHQSEDGKWTLHAKEGSRISATVENSVVTQLGGDIDLQIDDQDGPLLNGVVSGATLDLEELKATGSVELTTAREFLHPRATDGMVEGTDWTLKVLEGSGVSGQITENRLDSVAANLNMQVDDTEGPLADVTLQADWAMENDEVNGTGQMTLKREIPIAENLGPEAWTARVVPGAEATAHIEKNDFTKVTGGLNAKVADAESDFIDVKGEGTWTTADDNVEISGEAALTRDKVIEAASNGPWSTTALIGTKASTTITNETITEMAGHIEARLDKDGEGFVKAGLEGNWTPEGSVNGQGEAELLQEIDVAEAGEYHLFVEKGAGAQVAVEEGALSEIGGTVPMRLNEGETPFIKGGVEGTYKIEEKDLTGTGTAEVLVEKELGSLGNDKLFLMPGTGAQVTIQNNELTQVGGTINLDVRDDGGQYATISLAGTFDAAGGTGFTGTGATEVTREKELYKDGDYTFLIIPGTGATAHITENQLTKLDGQVPFEVRDAQGSLIKGSVSGEYSAETGLVNGSGDVRLGRTLEYDLGGGAVMKFLEGSGGDAEVKDSQLLRLGGTLKAELWTNGQAQVRVEADGNYNVVTNTLETLEGSAEMLRPFELLGGAIEVREVSGSAKIKDNQLVAAEGDGTIVIEPLNNMQGEFHVKWSNEGGQDQYEGTGKIDFTLFEDAAKGRKMEGEIDASYSSDGSLDVHGQATYTLNEMLKEIAIDVEMDEQLDPIIDIDADIDTNLVEGRNLFEMERDLLPRMTVPVYGPLGIFYGVKGGMKLDMDALHARAHIAVADWKPISEATNVPNFRADLDMNWGLDFMAQIVPYVGIECNIGVASVGGGIEGLAELTADLDVNPSGSIWGGDGIFGGELSVGVRLAPEITLGLTPFVEAQIVGLDGWRHDFAEIRQEVGNIMPFEWGGTYQFGDAPGPKTPPNAFAEGNVSQVTKQESATDTEMSNGGGGGGGTSMAGGPQFESGSEVAAQQETGEMSEMDRLLEILEKVQKLGKGIEALGYLVDLVIGVITATATLGPIGFIGYIVWKIFKRELSWDGIKEKIDNLVTALQVCADLLEPHLPDWFRRIRDVFSGRKPSLFDALFGADDRMRDAVREGYHREAPVEMLCEMVDTMASGWLSTDDANCIAQVFEEAARKGCLRTVIAAGGRDPGDYIDGFFSGFDDSAIKRVFRANGIDW